MATFHVIGDSLIDPEELFNKRFSGELEATRNLDFENSNKTISFANIGTFEFKTLLDVNKDLNPTFTPIGLGQPLSIEITTVYIGDYKKFLGGKKDVLIVSGIKNSLTFGASPRAINIKAKNVNERAFLSQSAFDEGTNIVYYTPAVDAEQMVVSFEIMFDNFNTKLFDIISTLATSAAGIPLFSPAAPFLLGGSQLINIGSKLGDAVFSGKPNLSESIPIRFESPIFPPTEPKSYVLYNEKDKAEFANLKMALVTDVNTNPQLKLVDKTSGDVYNGSASYLIVSLDGGTRQSLEAFAPTLASASILKQFYGASDKIGEVTGALQEAMQLYNDSNYKAKGERLKKQMAEKPKDSDEFKKLKNLYEAYAANIQNENFKLEPIKD
ncbi:hypothetical protein [Emticicia sp. BO119]|uniref:hypothetical protein n=1 Tax=Emticicia sp. BO119 TaxID=2757768 RepID=UPI0015F0EA1B|nr:hypothetical protein [Emticicia sp. BO119]MBA4853896.1 hypothetical protein [Emticicia sp. BO119]